MAASPGWAASRHRYRHRQRQNPVLQPTHSLTVCSATPKPAPSTSFPPKPWPRIRPSRCVNWFARLSTLPSLLTVGGRRSVATYDGDTPTSARPAIRQKARLVITNPDMLHTGILPHHTRWADFFRSLQFVVIDEMHVYRGVFGSHVANVLRRLKRIARFYGATPQFILTSATIANPLELAEQLIEEPGCPGRRRRRSQRQPNISLSTIRPLWITIWACGAAPCKRPSA